MNTTTTYTNTSAYWVDTLIKALNCNLCTLTRHTSNLTNSYQTIIDFRYLSLKQTLKELWSST